MDLDAQRSEMIRDHLRKRGIRDPAVLEAMREVPREAFVPDELKEYAYRDSPLPIGQGQTISQPFIVARMVELLALASSDRVLEIGTGSGYGAAVLSRIAATVYTIERHSALASQARRRLEALGYRNVHVLEGDGSLGWPDQAPYDAIVGTAGAPKVPEPLKAQLAGGGRLLLPVGSTLQQFLTLVRKGTNGDFEEKHLEAVRFVSLIGEAGWGR